MMDHDTALDALDRMQDGASFGHDEIREMTAVLAGMTFFGCVQRDSETGAMYPLVMDIEGSEDPVLAVATEERFLDTPDIPGVGIGKIPAPMLFGSTDHQRYTILIRRSPDMDDAIVLGHEQAASLHNLIELLARDAASGTGAPGPASTADAHSALPRGLRKLLHAYFRRSRDIQGVRLALVAVASDRTPDIVLLLDADEPAQHHASLEHLTRPLRSPGSFLRWELPEAISPGITPDDLPWFYRQDRDTGWLAGIARLFRPAPAIPFVHVQVTDS